MESPNKDSSIFLHVGYHKTATTFLQQKIFVNQKNILYLGYPWANKDFGAFFREFKNVNDLDFDEVFFINRFKEILANYTSRSGISVNKKPVVVSLESLHSGSEWFGRNVVTMINRISRVFEGARIIIGIRNQKQYILSNYAEYIIHGGKLRFNEFLYNSFAFNRSLGPKLHYDKILKLYRNSFGVSNVYPYLLEDLNQDTQKEVRNILNFISINPIDPFDISKVYTGLGSNLLKIIRIINSLLAKDFSEQYYLVGSSDPIGLQEKCRRKLLSLAHFLNKYFKFLSHRNEMNLKDLKHINKMYSESNKDLAKLLNREIESLGYVGGVL